jgi:CRISPR-associated exonuclease Cas4
MYSEDDLIVISALQHFVYCPRQCALIHVEDVWHENLYTTRGAILHEKVDTDTYESRGTLKTVRGLRIHSFRLGLVGRADVVEFRQAAVAGDPPEPMPVEFKSGEPKEDISDKVQLCAQALCLEEMLDRPVPKGAFFYGKIRRRVQVEISDELRGQTGEIIAAVRDIVDRKVIPHAKYSSKCRNCSLYDICSPKAMNERKLHTYINTLYQA